jgi:hypothetical protein
VTGSADRLLLMISLLSMEIRYLRMICPSENKARDDLHKGHSLGYRLRGNHRYESRAVRRPTGLRSGYHLPPDCGITGVESSTGSGGSQRIVLLHITSYTLARRLLCTLFVCKCCLRYYDPSY